MLRARFKANKEDYRSVNWPVKYPYWCTGYGEDYSIVVAYVDDLETLLENWPEASDIDFEEVSTIEVSTIEVSDRFPKPDWYSE